MDRPRFLAMHHLDASTSRFDGGSIGSASYPLSSSDIRVSSYDTTSQSPLSRLPRLVHRKDQKNPDGFIPSELSSRDRHHFSMIFSLASQVAAEKHSMDDPDLFNTLRNLEESDVSTITSTSYIGRGATFAVRRTKFPPTTKTNVVFKSLISSHNITDGRRKRMHDRMQQLDAVLLELRVLSHEPIRESPYVVKLLQVGWEADPLDLEIKWPVLILENAELGTLADLCEWRLDGLSFEVRRKLCSHVAKGLITLQSCDIIHGDLKLDNVLVFVDRRNGHESLTAKLSDFGGCRFEKLDSALRPMGTRPWIAPERFLKVDDEIDYFKADVYSFGLLIWHFFSDAKPPCELFEIVGDLDECISAAEMKMRHSDFTNFVLQSLEKYMTSETYHVIKPSIYYTIQLDIHQRCIDCTAACLEDLDQSICPSNHHRLERIDTKSPFKINNTGVSLDEDDNLEALDLESEIYAVDGIRSASTQRKVNEEEGSSSDALQLTLPSAPFQGVTSSLAAQYLQSLEETATLSTGSEDSLHARLLLVPLYLGGSDFNLDTDVDKGLNHALDLAEIGLSEQRALLLRLHRAFGRPHPPQISISTIRRWLTEAAANGSQTAMMDLRYEKWDIEAEEAAKLLKTQYCGFGQDVFDMDEEVYAAFILNQDCGAYIEKEFSEMTGPHSNIPQYLLWQAAAYGNTPAISILINKGVNPDASNERNETALFYAARSGHSSVVIRLLELGADPRKVSHSGETALHWLSAFEIPDMQAVCERLIEHGADIDAQSLPFPPEGSLGHVEMEYPAGTPLHRAIARGNIDAVYTLLQHGASATTPSACGDSSTPIALAAKLHYATILRICLEKDLRPRTESLCDTYGMSLLEIAIGGRGSINSFEYGRLIRHGASRHKAAEDTFNTLLDLGATAHLTALPGRGGQSALHFATGCSSEATKYLLTHGCMPDINRRCFFSDSPTLKLVSRTDDLERPPLFESIIAGKSEVCRLLITAGADLTQPMNDLDPVTALYECAWRGFENSDIINALILAANVDAGPASHETPFSCAVRKGSYSLAKRLKQAGANADSLALKGRGYYTLRPVTILYNLITANSPSAVNSLRFLLQQEYGPGILVGPTLQRNVFHALAIIPGDSLDPTSIRQAFVLCLEYFRPDELTLNQQDIADKNDEVTWQTLGGNTALHLAATNGNLEIVEELLKAGAKPDIPNTSETTALTLAYLSRDTYQEEFKVQPIPISPVRQRDIGQRRRNKIVELLENATKKFR